jgi:redox-sensing transcriptional repressor
VVIGAGNLGMALANYDGFHGENFRVVAVCDNDPAKVGTTSATGVPVYAVDRLGEIVAAESIDIAAIAVPGQAAQAALDEVVAVGIRAVLNFAPARITGPAWVKIRNVDLMISLEGLSYALARPHGSQAEEVAESEVEVTEEHEPV